MTFYLGPTVVNIPPLPKRKRQARPLLTMVCSSMFFSISAAANFADSQSLMGWVQISFSFFGKEVEFLRRSAAVMENDGLAKLGLRVNRALCMPCCTQLLY